MALGKWIGSALGWILSGGNVLGAIAGYCIGSLLSDATSTAERDNGFNGNGNTFRNDYSDTQFNQRPFEEDRNSFLFSMLVLSSYIIKADGKIMHSEMNCVRNFLRNNFGEQAVRQGEDILLKLFEMQKQQGATTFKETIRKSCVEISFHMNIGQRLQLLDYLIIIAKVDGTVSPEEVYALKEVATYLGLSAQDVDSMLNMEASSNQQIGLDEAYKILGISPNATNDEVKAAYRKMALKHHPDRVSTLGDDVREAAEKKFQEINNAKERIYKARGL
ncbi:DnaJ domain-containing protein [Prevotella pallens]|jgi:dnaJ domain protein|uniref:DnaJ domain-containing protein n=1 Tax=Prevotella pallens TaxID=60133 RepID=UPI001CB17686|nr:DnaJ domain-containing protein [Prevotella pallens]MBF1502878.1 TerB family tellurite resistance protein [Prevotella pallens]MBF1508927.1 TerB family tellurite resistance protein [Prevotella pallens]MBF1511779.1 TerB family tellurite resistance protein [Prevotella pallens]MBF1516479.1 TerB family tellurite resistance protein [Prevotella pallens]